MKSILASFLKLLVIALTLFLAYNEFVTMHRPSAFEKIVAQQDKADVLQAINSPSYVYQCGSGQPPNYYLYIENLCVDGAVEVEAFPICYLPLRCPGWLYVGFNKDGKTASKYRLPGN